MKRIFSISIPIPLILSILIISSCKKDKPTPPVLTTTGVTAISYTTANSGGIVTNEGGTPIISRGVCWNTEANPTMTNNITNDGNGLGVFISNLTQLTTNTRYYVRAYAMNIAGTGYGNQVSFITSQVNIPVLSTASSDSITSTTVRSGGNVINDSGDSVKARGVCWSTSINPTSALITKTSDGTGTGVFTSRITGLTVHTTYYVRSYGTNSIGTGYGKEISFTTKAIVPTLTTTAASSITQTTITTGGDVTSDGGSDVTVRGVCWSMMKGPNAGMFTKTIDGIGKGTFISELTGLTAYTTYYVRSYATNSIGTAYGNEISFTTAPTMPGIMTTVASLVTQTSAISGGSITGYGTSGVTVRGVCWGTSTGPTTALSSKTTDGAGMGVFTSSITGLVLNTIYYVRAYATNSVGTVYGNEVVFSTKGANGNVTDIEGNTYSTIEIGTQVWMAENLKTTKYNDGTAIPNITDDITWQLTNTGAYGDYSNTPSNSITYGRLYNWYAVDNNVATKVASNGGKNVCPTSWHVPSYDEWTIFVAYVGGANVAGGKLKETGTVHWQTPNAGATNEAGFTALPGGYHNFYGFYGIGVYGYWWSSTVYSTTVVSYWNIYSEYVFTTIISGDLRKEGISVRCIKDF